MAEDTSLQDMIALLANPKELQARTAEYVGLKAEATKMYDGAKMAKIEAAQLLSDASAAATENAAKAARLDKALADARESQDKAAAAISEAQAAKTAADEAARDYAARASAVEAERGKLATAIGDANNAELKWNGAIAALKATIAGLNI